METTSTSVVSLNSPMKIPTMLGIEMRNACGKTILRVVCQRLRPSARPASVCPFVTA